MNQRILIRGGGDLASGVALRLHHAGFDVVIAELPRPLAVRRLVSFSEAVYAGQIVVEDAAARLVTPDQIESTLARREIPVLVDPEISQLPITNYQIIIDARLLKTSPPPQPPPLPHKKGRGPRITAPPDSPHQNHTRPTATPSSRRAAATPSDASTGREAPRPTADSPKATRAASCAPTPTGPSSRTRPSATISKRDNSSPRSIQRLKIEKLKSTAPSKASCADYSPTAWK
ncbi:MAG: hypothetical protein KJZ57_13390 [Anaerolineales bacterium]|nr:hypothetical protein [Anaerolineales bacterium]